MLHTDERGSISIESCIIIPIFLLIIVFFVNIINYIELNGEIDIKQKSYLLKNQLEGKVQNSINLEIDNKRKIAEDKVTKSENDILTIESKGYYDTHINLFRLSKIEVNNTSSIRVFNNGDSIKDYGIVREKINLDYDIWSLDNLERGIAIGDIMGNNNGYSGDEIDIIDDYEIVSIISIDIRDESYLGVEGISNKIVKNINTLKSYKDTKSRDKVLNIVVPTDNINEVMKFEFNKIRRECKNQNIEFKLTAIESN